ncbi:replication initiation and membrane attachment family protein [Abyssicoccus albus]|uniref:Replicative DNA helicase loader DnaB n=1 Tax=Abyssicoccus albus TaxID=1817405 RepID=A0A3N5BIT9_9BACL|nr:DnaD domain protein [Abyssicoccus albus]RPF57734.1 replicative DNA helicase loader DnaB [Abyssicoccus albus]
MHFTEMNPHDEFNVSISYYPSIMTHDILHALYVPIVGYDSVALYEYMMRFQSRPSQFQNHYIFMKELNMPLRVFEQTRHKLEAIGLIKTFVNTIDELNIFEYELVKPMSPNEYFNDPMMNVFLYKTVEKDRYLELRQQFVKSHTIHSDFKEVTKRYEEVFDHKLNHQMDESVNDPSTVQFVKDNESGGIPSEPSFDFELFQTLLRNNYIDLDSFTTETKQLIEQLSNLYSISPNHMKGILLDSLNGDKSINHKLLAQRARNFYQIEHNGQLPNIKLKDQQQDLSNQAHQIDERAQNESQSSKAQWFELQDKTPPIERFYMVSGGKVTEEDKKLIERITQETELPYGVANILIEYVYQLKDKTLPQKFTIQIAAQWAREGLKNAQQAMDYAKSYQQRQKQKQFDQQNRFKTKGVTPEWLERERQHNQQTKGNFSSTDNGHKNDQSSGSSEHEQDEETKQSIEAFQKILKQYKEGGKK